MRRSETKALCVWIALAFALCCGTTALAEESGRATQPAEISLANSTAAPKPEESPWRLEAKLKRLVNSHTSYEFGNPLPPNQAPLSRLEFPLDSFWGGLEMRRSFSRFSAGVEFLTSVTDQEAGRFKDSDWADDAQPRRMTNYGEADCRLETSYQLRLDADAQVADLMGLSRRIDLRPVIGFRWQRFSLVAHDGEQFNYDTPGAPPQVIALRNDVLTFQQNWYQYFMGVKMGYDLGPLFGLHRLKVGTQLDWAYVEGENEDHHLLRGDRVTREDTCGDAWHASVELLAGITKSLDLGLELDYLRIHTTGGHELRDGPDVLTWSNDVKVWSEQTGLLLKLVYRF